MVTGLFVCLLMLIRQSRLHSISYKILFEATVYAGFSGVIGANLLYVFVNYHNLTIAQMLDPTTGHMFFGFFIFFVFTIIIYGKIKNIPAMHIANVSIVAWASAQCVALFACLFAGCCYGKSTDITWAITFVHESSRSPIGIPLHPTQIYDIVAVFLIMLVLVYMENIPQYSSYLFLIYMLLYSLSRIILDNFRGDARGTIYDLITVSQGIAIIVLVLSFLLFLFRKYL